jgi:hypothetical protein
MVPGELKTVHGAAMKRYVSVFVFVGPRPVHIPPFKEFDNYGVSDEDDGHIPDSMRARALFDRIAANLVQAEVDRTLTGEP